MFELDRQCVFLLTFCFYGISDAAGYLFWRRAGGPRLGNTRGKRREAVEQDRCSSSVLLPLFGWPCECSRFVEKGRRLRHGACTCNVLASNAMRPAKEGVTESAKATTQNVKLGVAEDLRREKSDNR